MYPKEDFVCSYWTEVGNCNRVSIFPMPRSIAKVPNFERRKGRTAFASAVAFEYAGLPFMGKI
jgi:hypothetical protein